MKRLLSLLSCLALVLCAVGAEAGVKNPDTFVLADYRTVQTIDPAASYDVAGSMRIWNMYETLIFFDGSSTEKFVPLLAAEVPTVENGGISADGKTYTFKIRKGVKFHAGGELTPEDVVYSFKRHMILDPDGGPMWMLLEALTGKGSTRDKDGKIIPGVCV
ncbi:MAG: ABC transporter substrate-binding protein [Desulfobacterales bacterium]|jgi:peptide/nickel transport system substrate-binding protein